jgi:glycosyltransferase involved in cell wall biosynthesis
MTHPSEAKRRGAASPLDVLHVLWRGTGGGAERHVLDLCGEFARRDVRTGVLYLKNDAGAGPDLDCLGVLHQSCGLERGNDPRGPLRVAAAVRLLRPRLLHDHVSTPWLRTFLPGSRAMTIVATEHGHLLRPIFAREGIRLWIERLGARRTDLYIAPSRAIAASIEARYRFPADRIRVIPHGIRSPVEGLPPATRGEVRRELSVEEGQIAVLFVGRLDETKGILDLLDAFWRITRATRALGEGSDPILLVAGAGELAGPLRERIARDGLEGRVRMLGFRTDVGRLLMGADLFVLPARHEAFGIVLLEAMAAELPVVATRTGGIPEIVVDGQTGILVEPDNPEGLARALLELAGDAGKRQSLGRAGRERWARDFSLDRSVESTLEAYRWAQRISM